MVKKILFECNFNRDTIFCLFFSRCPSQPESQGSCGGEEKVINNPIGSLQEMCMSRHWPPPKYTMDSETGLPHERQFTIVCLMLKYRQVGMGKSKKLAKRQAAHKMWQALRDLPETTTGLDDDDVRFLFIFIIYQLDL